jgi:translation initiation factor IF-1
MLRERMERGAELDGTVLRALPNALYEVGVTDGRQVLAHLSDALRLNVPRIVPGDGVRLEVSPYDHGRGRIVEHRRAPRR